MQNPFPPTPCFIRKLPDGAFAVLLSIQVLALEYPFFGLHVYQYPIDCKRLEFFNAER